MTTTGTETRRGPTTTKPLTDKRIKAAKPERDTYRLRDTGGLFLEVRPTGAMLWRWQYRFGGKGGRVLALGRYPEVSLKRARERRDEAKSVLANGIDPAAQRREEKLAKRQEEEGPLTFRVVALEMLAKRAASMDPRSEAQHGRRLETYAYPAIGDMPIEQVEAKHLREIVQAIEADGKGELAHRLRTLMGQVLRYGVGQGYLERDPSGALKGALMKVTPKHHPAVVEPEKFAPILRAIHGYDGDPVVYAALRLAPLVFVRPGELVRMRWADVDRKAAQWRFVASKTSTDMIVPLARQALAILDEVEPLTGREQLVFHSMRSKSKLLSENTLNAALRYASIDTRTTQCAHGFRATARTMLEEQLRFRYEVIEMQLGHRVRDANGRAYNRTAHLEERTKMMQAWGDYLDQLNNHDLDMTGGTDGPGPYA